MFIRVQKLKDIISISAMSLRFVLLSKLNGFKAKYYSMLFIPFLMLFSYLILPRSNNNITEITNEPMFIGPNHR